MKATKTKTLLVVIGIVLGTTLGTNILYPFITKLEKDRALSIGENETRTVHAKRGKIIDRDGVVIAYEDSTSYSIKLDCTAFLSATQDTSAWRFYAGELAESLAGMFPQRDTIEWYQYLLEGNMREEKYLPIADGLSKEDADRVREFPLFCYRPNYGGGRIEIKYHRNHPFDQLALSTIGTIYADTIMTGLERSFDSILDGEDGTEVIRTGNYYGQLISQVDCIEKVRHGMDIHTTLSVKLQSTADSLLRIAIDDNEDIDSGCFLLMDTKTGALRAMVNLSKTDDQGGAEVRNEAIGRSFQPGSLAQAMTYAALMTDGKILSLNDKIPTNHGMINNLIRDAHIVDYERRANSDSLTVRDGFAISSNYVPAFLIQKYYNKSPELFIEHLQTYCPGLDFDLNGLASNQIITPDSIAWTNKSLSCLSYGYGMQLTPISLLTFYNSLANKGQMMKPYLVEKATDDQGSCINYGPVVLGQVMTKDVAFELLRGLKYATETGLASRIKDWTPDIIGKTGTARINLGKMDENQYVSTFVGFIPANGLAEPEYSVMCVLFTKSINKPFYGNTVPACVVRDFVNKIM